MEDLKYKRPFKDYLGSKYNCYQWIINKIPKHKLYCEPFIGNGGIYNNLEKNNSRAILADADPEVCQRWNELGVKVLNIDFKSYATWLKAFDSSSTFMYLDPPYLHSTRKSKHRYKYEFSVEDHEHLLNVVRELDIYVMLSCYDNQLYKKMLTGWKKSHLKVITRGRAMATETIYMNYEQPKELHDYRYLGENFTQRQQIKRKLSRNVKNISKWPINQQYAILKELNKNLSPW